MTVSILAAMEMRNSVYILQESNCFENKHLRWPSDINKIRIREAHNISTYHAINKGKKFGNNGVTGPSIICKMR